MLHIIAEMEKQKAETLHKAEDLFAEAHRIETALSILRDGTVVAKKSCKKTDSQEEIQSSRKNGPSPTKNIPYGQRGKVVCNHIEHLCRMNGGSMPMKEIRKSLIETGLLKRNAPSPSMYLCSSKKFVFDKAQKVWKLRQIVATKTA